MPERWESELRKLRTLSVPETVPQPGRYEHGIPGPSRVQRAVALVVSLAVFAGAAFFAWYAFGSGGDGSPAGDHSPAASTLPPDVGRISCTKHGTQVWTPVIRPKPDGVHLLVDDVSGGKWLVLRSPRDTATSSREGWLASANGSYRLDLGNQRDVRVFSSPGTGFVSCAPGADRFSGLRSAYERIKIVDPAGLWGDPKLVCKRRDATRFDVHGYDQGNSWDVTSEEVRQNLPSLGPSDDVRLAGYPEVDMWKIGRWFVVVRNDQTIATVTFWQVDGAATIYACPGSGITRPDHPWNET
jgi:hypothetical protein